VAEAGIHPLLLQGLGLVSIQRLIFTLFGLYQPVRKAVAEPNWPEAARHLPRIRRIIAINLVLGLITVALGAVGRI
nr:hypothetical protein [Alphaproteobacteria bacterium]